MSKLKSLPLALTVLGLGATASFSEIKLTDNLSTAGFVDMSINGNTPDSGKSALNASLDQYELDFMYKFGPVSARADLNATPSLGSPGTPAAEPAFGATSSAVYLEQAYVNYSMGATGFSVGRFLSSSGFEAAEPTGLFQYSTSKTLVYGYYQNGVNFNYSTPMFGLYGAVVSDLWAPLEYDLKTPGFEGQVSVMPAEGITVKAAYLYQVYDEDVTGYTGQALANIWAQYAMGPLTLAAEYNNMMNWKAKDETGNGWLAMANYKFATNYAATVRYSGIKFKTPKDADTEVTFSPSVTLSPNWLALAEVKFEIEKKNTSYALENTFSF